MEESTLRGLIEKAQQGDECSRQLIIQESKSFVERLTIRICRRMVSWNDDEMSISFIAFNEAIDRYNPLQNDHFYTYAKLVIHSRLIDYFRKEGRQHQAVSLDAVSRDEEGKEIEINAAESEHSWHQYNEQQMIQARMEEIQVYSARLEEFGIHFEELEEASPERTDARNNLIQIANDFVTYPHLVEFLTETKQLPLKQMLDFVQVSRKTVERGRKYLIALVVILLADDLPYLKSSIAFPDLERRAN